jgi:hypothetical protein
VETLGVEVQDPLHEVRVGHHGAAVRTGGVSVLGIPAVGPATVVRPRVGDGLALVVGGADEFIGVVARGVRAGVAELPLPGRGQDRVDAVDDGGRAAVANEWLDTRRGGEYRHSCRVGVVIHRHGALHSRGLPRLVQEDEEVARGAVVNRGVSGVYEIERRVDAEFDLQRRHLVELEAGEHGALVAEPLIAAENDGVNVAGAPGWAVLVANNLAGQDHVAVRLVGLCRVVQRGVLLHAPAVVVGLLVRAAAEGGNDVLLRLEGAARVAVTYEHGRAVRVGIDDDLRLVAVGHVVPIGVAEQEGGLLSGVHPRRGVLAVRQAVVCAVRRRDRGVRGPVVGGDRSRWIEARVVGGPGVVGVGCRGDVGVDLEIICHHC